MSLIELKTFLAVIEARGVSSAAINLNMTQPAITKRLKNLKMYFEIENLYTRKNGEFIIGEEAKLLLPFAQNVVALEENAKNEIKNYTHGIKGKIFIGAGTTLSLGDLPVFSPVNTIKEPPFPNFPSEFLMASSTNSNSFKFLYTLLILRYSHSI